LPGSPWPSGRSFPAEIDRPGKCLGPRHHIFLENNQYLRELSLARLGVVPCLLSQLFWFGAGAGNAAVRTTILFATTVLGHAGLATTDIAITATLTGTLEAIRSGGNSPIPFDELMEVSEATFAVEEAIGSGTRI